MKFVKTKLNPVTTILCLGSLALIAAYFLRPNSSFLDLDKEFNLPSFYESLLFLFAAAGAFSNCGRRMTVSTAQWALMGMALVFAGADEWFGFHEQITAMAVRLSHGAKLHNVWMLLYVPILYGAILFFKKLWLDVKVAKPLCAWLMAFALLAWFTSFPAELLVQWRVLPEFLWRYEIALEEGLEMAGSILLFYAFFSVPRQR